MAILNKHRALSLTLVIVIVGGILIAGIIFKSKLTAVETTFWEEIFKVRQHTKYDTVGRDTIYVLGDGKFQIGKFADDKVFFMYNENKTIEALLRSVSKYKYDNGNLYVISNEGYGIADSKTNTCKLYITVQEEDFVRGYSVDSDGIQHSISRLIDDEHIEYLKSYNDFADDERSMFERLKNDNKAKQ